jgi:hypothetical protein
MGSHVSNRHNEHVGYQSLKEITTSYIMYMERLKVISVTPQQNQVLHVEFNTSVRKKYDVRMLLSSFPSTGFWSKNRCLIRCMLTVEAVRLHGLPILTFPNGNYGITTQVFNCSGYRHNKYPRTAFE